ncbi:MAG TPA: bifunctional acyl-CoA synthetase/GNAT family N-acetyltransferase [Thioalkalivibrio sp.]|nr:bifunctional acyl-CoA synthetase/GNAT family N-acetyltransferase [Thioalkalivibrio sp.]
MGPHYLNKLFRPHSIAVFGASERENAVGTRVFANLLSAGFKGELYPVNPKHKRVQGRRCFSSLDKVDAPVDLAVIATPAATVPGIIRDCGEHGIRAAVILTAGFAEMGRKGEALQQELTDTARRYDMRIIGPNCLGVMRPDIGLNATFSRNHARPGNVALISQSGALCTAILDWAEARGVGFSSVISLGDAADLDFGDLLDYLAMDDRTKSILLYVEGVRKARRFMSGLRVAARLKPVIAVKAGRHEAGSRAAASHTGALVGADDVFDAALERAGAVRAHSVSEFFAAAEILARDLQVRGNRLGIVTNGGGPGVIATDRAIEVGLAIATPSPASMEALNQALPEHWSHGNPVDVLGDAPPERYRAAVSTLLADEACDGVLVMLTPQAMTDPDGVARAVIEARKGSDKPVLACWMGNGHVEAARERFSGAGIPEFSTPEAAVEAFGYLAAYTRNQQLLLQVPGPLADRADEHRAAARMIIEAALAEGRQILTLTESKAILAAFHIPVTRAAAARNANEALVAAETVGYPVAMKIDSPDLTHKSDVDGVRLNLADAQTVRSTFTEMMDAARRLAPQADIRGVTVERMARNRNARELMIGVIRDPVFGPAISFGLGGTAVEVLHDRAVALPPLNARIVETLIGQTRAARLLDQFRQLPPVRRKGLEDTLLKVSDLVCELPEVRELDINPLMADEAGVVAVDARIVVAPPGSSLDRYAHMAIHPYPYDLVHDWQLPDGTRITIRPIRPEDAEIERDFVRNLSEESRYFRFMQALHELTPKMLVRFTQIDYDEEMAFIAVTEVDGHEQELGVARYSINPDRESCEFALVVDDRWHHRGIGSQLMKSLMQAARSKGLRRMEGEVLASNRRMLELAEFLGFSQRPGTEDVEIIEVWREL